MEGLQPAAVLDPWSGPPGHHATGAWSCELSESAAGGKGRCGNDLPTPPGVNDRAAFCAARSSAHGQPKQGIGDVNDPICHPRSRSAPRPKGSFTSPFAAADRRVSNQAAIPERVIRLVVPFVQHGGAQRAATGEAPTASMLEHQARLKAALTPFGASRP